MPNLKRQPEGLADALAAAGRALLAVAEAMGAGHLSAPLPPVSTGIPVECPPEMFDLVNEALISKSQGNRRKRYLLQLRSSWKLFCDDYGTLAPAEVTAAVCEAWIAGRQVAPRTARGYLIDLRTLFSFAVKRGYVPANPVLGVDLPKLDDRPPCIHSPEEVGKILAAAARLDVDVLRVLAVQYFAGLRPSEALQLTEAELSPDFIEVKAARGKSRKRRLVSVGETLQAFLAAGGCLPVPNFTKRWRAVRAAAGVPWGPDVTRHSFASYHLAAHRSQDRTATEMGHHSSVILFAHYRALVTPAQARQFWALRPELPGAGAAPG